MPDRSKDWQKWEQEVADAINGERVLGSGSSDKYKGDVKSDTFLVECKWTGSNSYNLSRTLWEKVSMWARNEQRIPVVAVCAASGRAVVVPEWWYCEKVPEAKFGDMVSRKNIVINPSIVENGPTIRCFAHERVVVVKFKEFADLCS